MISARTRKLGLGLLVAAALSLQAGIPIAIFMGYLSIAIQQINKQL